VAQDGAHAAPVAVAGRIAVADRAGDFSRVKTCVGHGYTLMFIDRTRGNARRWCSVAVCGNRAKQAAHRERGHGRAGVGPARALRCGLNLYGPRQQNSRVSRGHLGYEGSCSYGTGNRFRLESGLSGGAVA
jgi:hypothetical protein